MRWTCSIQGENVQRRVGWAGFRGDWKVEGVGGVWVVKFEVGLGLGVEGEESECRVLGDRAERVRCLRASQGAGRSRKMQSACGVSVEGASVEKDEVWRGGRQKPSL